LKRPLRVLIIETQSQPGGMWHYASSLSRALGEQGLDVTLATIEPFEALGDHAGVRIRSLGVRAAGVGSGAAHWLRRGLGQIDRWKRLRAVIREVRPDLVHLHNLLGKSDFMGLRWLRALGIPLVLTAHDPVPDTGLTAFDWARYRGADAIIVHSLNGIEDLIRGGVQASRIRRVHHGSYLHLCPESSLSMSEARRLIGLRDDHRVILFFGTIARYKGLDVLIDAFAQISGDMPGARLVIAGEPLEPFAPYSAQIRDRGVADKVVLDLRYIPFEEFPKYFQAADVVAFPYRNIYQSGVLQLAYGYGRPVVATSVGGLGEIVADDQSGLIAPPENPPALATAIRCLFQDSDAAREMGRRGRRAAENKYSWHAVVRDVIDVYRSVCECRLRAGEEAPSSALHRS
jgi:glycosyltransferase involved in cell wall biosynthesis